MKLEKTHIILILVLLVLVGTTIFAFIGIENVDIKMKEAQQNKLNVIRKEYLTTAEVDAYIERGVENPDFTIHVYIGNGGYSRWYTQKLFILRNKEIFDYLVAHKVKFDLLLGDEITAERRNDSTLMRDSYELKSRDITGALGYSINDKNARLLMVIKGNIPINEAFDIFKQCFDKGVVNEDVEIVIKDYEKIRKAEIAKRQKELDKRALRNMQRRNINPVIREEEISQEQEQEIMESMQKRVQELAPIKHTLCEQKEQKQTSVQKEAFSTLGIQGTPKNPQPKSKPQSQKSDSTLF